MSDSPESPHYVVEQHQLLLQLDRLKRHFAAGFIVFVLVADSSKEKDLHLDMQCIPVYLSVCFVSSCVDAGCVIQLS